MIDTIAGMVVMVSDQQKALDSTPKNSDLMLDPTWNQEAFVGLKLRQKFYFNY
jgi:hypothetical protein